MLERYCTLLYKAIIYHHTIASYPRTINYILNFLVLPQLTMPNKSTFSSEPSTPTDPSTISYSIPLPLSGSNYTPLAPPPFPKALESYFHETEDPLLKKTTEGNSNLIPMQFSEQCYQLTATVNRDNNCYELHSEDPYASPSISSKTGRKCSESIYGSHDSESNINRLIAHQKKLAVLKSSENVKPDILTRLEEGELSKSDEDLNTFNTPVFKPIRMEMKSSPLLNLKRSRSTAALDAIEESSTPKRKTENFECERKRHSRFDSPTSDSYHRRKSLPARTELSTGDIASGSALRNSFDRRKSFPLTPYSSPSSGATYKRCTTDQTPYATPFQQRKRMRSILPYYNAFELLTLESESGFVDSHCHLDFLFDRQGYHGTYSEYQAEHRDTFPKCYGGCLAVFCNPFTFNKSYKWQKFLEEENVWASFGCHPHNAKDYSDDVERHLLVALEHSKVRALGEIGLDYSNRNNCMKEKQFEALRRQLKIALKKELPVVIHCREAHEDGINIIKEILPLDYTIHLHCFTDTWDWAKKWLETFPNLFIGFTNVVTFPSAESVHEVVRNIPLERLLLETDAPYFVPRTVARETRHSHPGMAIHVAAQIAALRNEPLERVLQATRKNTKRVYNI